MPARRLPWFKLWPEAMRHEKIVLLSDGAFRTWITVLAAGSEQGVRWRFATVKHAASVTGRPAKHIRELIAARLIDEGDSGELWVHDWRQWQDRYASDVAPRREAEHSVNGHGTLREQSANGSPPSPPPDPPLSPRRGESETGEAEGEGEVTSPQPPPQAEGERPKPRRRRRDEPVEEPVTPLTPADRDRWEAAVTYLARAMPPPRLAGLVRPLEPIGRAQDGGLLLRAPPRIARDALGLISVLGRALESVGDEHGQRAAIVK